MKTILTIAGSDSSGGAGIQADLKTIAVHKMYGMSVITSVTSQNTMGVQAVHDIPKEHVKSQLEAVCSDIIPNSVKIGMVSNKENIIVISDIIEKYSLKNIVIDPVMISTSGKSLLEDEGIKYLRDLLMKKATLVTPNIGEAELLSEIKIYNYEDVKKACKIIFDNSGAPVLIKGGHMNYGASDILFDGASYYEISGEKFHSENNHGTGCTLSSSIGCNLAKGYDLYKACEKGKRFVEALLKDGMNLGKGNGPLNHIGWSEDN